MTTVPPESFEDRSAVRDALPWMIGLAALLALFWFVYTQLTIVSGIRVDNPLKTVVDVTPLPEPPTPPPQPPLKQAPREPTEQPQPSPSEAPRAPQPQAAPVTIAAPAQAGVDSYGVNAGAGGGIGAPSSTATCLGAHCGAKPSGGGMADGLAESVYRRYLSSVLEARVRGDDKLSRLVFSADLELSVTADGRVAGVRLLGARGRNDDETQRKLAELLGAVRGLNAPPASMVFPQRVTVRGRRGI